ncbi:MAG: hypothetical protein WCG74_10615 [Sediminibacterium sp.]
MISLHPQFIKDSNGNNTLVVLSASEFNNIIEELEDNDDVKQYDSANISSENERISLADYKKIREAKNA